MLLLYLEQNEHRGGEERSKHSIKCGEKTTATTDADTVCFGHWEIWYH